MIAGAGFGAAKALEEILGEQMLRAQMAERERAARAQEALERQRLLQNQQAMETESGQRQQQIDLQAGDRRERQNITGVRRMLGEAIVQRQGAISPDDRRGLAALQIEAGDEPTLLNEPKVQRFPVTTRGAKGEPIRKLLTEDELAAGVEEYREPKSGPQPEHEWVMRGGKPVQIRKGTAQPGDAPYDAVASRQKDGQQETHPYTIEHSRNVIRKIDDLIGKDDDPATPENEAKPNRVNWRTSGVVGNVLSSSMVPWQTKAKDVDAELFSLASELAITALQKMREASKTGGAVGNVALGEMQMMQNAQAAIRLDQSPENLRRQLGIIRSSEQTFLDALERESNSRMNRGITVDASSLPDEATAAANALIERARKSRKPQ